MAALLAFVTSCNNIQKSKSLKKTTSPPLTAPVYFYLLKYGNGSLVQAQKDDFLKDIETINKSLINLNPQILSGNRYESWRQKINKIDSTQLGVERLNKLTDELQFYFRLNYNSNLLILSANDRNKVLKDAFFINNGFDFYSDLWYLQPYLTIEQNSYHQLIEKSKLFNLVLTGESDDMTDFTADWIKKEDNDGFPLPFFRIINPGLAKKAQNELESKFLIGDDKNNASFQLLDDFLNKEVNKQAIILIKYLE